MKMDLNLSDAYKANIPQSAEAKVIEYHKSPKLG